MKKILILAMFVFIPFATINATQIDGSDTPNTPNISKPKSKLQRIQDQINKYQRIIDNYPSKLKQSEEQFNRLKQLGNKIQEVLKNYVSAIDSCSNNAHSDTGKDACKEFIRLDLGSEIKRRKAKVMEMIEVAKSELNKVKAEGEDMVIIKNLLKSLTATKEMLMR